MSICSVQNSGGARERRQRLPLNGGNRGPIFYVGACAPCRPGLAGLSLPSRSLRCCAQLSASLRCRTVLLDAVISSVHGQITVCSILSAGGLRDGGMSGGGERVSVEEALN